MNKNKILGFATFGLFGLAYLISLISKLFNDMSGFFNMFQNFGAYFELILVFLLEFLLAIGVLVLSIFGILKAIKDDDSKLDPFTTFILLGIGGVALLQIILTMIWSARNGGGVHLEGRAIVYLLFVVFVVAGALLHMFLKGNKMIGALAGLVAAVSLLVIAILNLSNGGNGLGIVFNIFVMLGAVAAAGVYALPLLSK